MSREMTETSKTILSELAAIDSGGLCRLPVTPELYPVESLNAAALAFAGYCEISVDRVPREHRTVLSIRMRDEHRRASRQIVGSFLSFLLDHAFQIRLRGEAER